MQIKVVFGFSILCVQAIYNLIMTTLCTGIQVIYVPVLDNVSASFLELLNLIMIINGICNQAIYELDYVVVSELQQISDYTPNMCVHLHL